MAHSGSLQCINFISLPPPPIQNNYVITVYGTKEKYLNKIPCELLSRIEKKNKTSQVVTIWTEQRIKWILSLTNGYTMHSIDIMFSRVFFWGTNKRTKKLHIITQTSISIGECILVFIMFNY